MLRLYNVTDAQVELWGTSSYVEYLASAAGYSKLFGKITIAAAKVFEFQHNCNSFGVPRLGFEMGYGWTVPHETYTWAKIRKVA